MRNKIKKEKWQPKDNQTFLEKSRLRKKLLRLAPQPPVILETHGGEGELYRACYTDVSEGVVFETDPAKAEVLVHQRPTWTVCQSDCVLGIASGVGDHLQINFIDADPYGAAWDVLEAFFASDRPFVEKMMLCVHDGLKGGLSRWGGKNYPYLHPILDKIGEADAHKHYLEICRYLLPSIVGKAGYEVKRFGGFYSLANQNQTHFFAEIVK